eukprot:6269743-Ditylum_brightwellii.AAC.2
MKLSVWSCNLRLTNNWVSKGKDNVSRASSTDFWWSLYQRGLDIVNLEYNFLLPEDYFKVQSELWTVTMLCNPWDRFQSTYKKELSRRCRKCEDVKCTNLTETCYEENNMEMWMYHGTGIQSKEQRRRWGGILSPNYYTRMLNGLGDVHDAELTQSHLDTAKKVLGTFDHVLILEMPDASKIEKLNAFLGDDINDRKLKGRVGFPSQSNNILKEDPMYRTIRNKIDKHKGLFEEQNKLDIELYAYAKELSSAKG